MINRNSKKNISYLTNSVFSKITEDILTDEVVEEISNNFICYFELLMEWNNSKNGEGKNEKSV